MALVNVPALRFNNSAIFGTYSKPFISFQMQTRSTDSCELPDNLLGLPKKPLVIEARANAKKESAKIRNRRMRKKFNGTATKPRLSVFCSDKQLYAMLVDDQNKKCLFYGSTLQKSIRGNPPCTTIEAAQRVGEELIKACIDLNVNEISWYDRNGLARGQRMQAFETAISLHGFLPG